jgi:hypothetical protein
MYLGSESLRSHYTADILHLIGESEAVIVDSKMQQ